MNGLAEKLARLRRQAGAAAVGTGGRSALPAPAPPQAATVADELQRLRRLLQRRPPTLLRPAPAAGQHLRGSEIAPGVYAVEQSWADPATTALLPPRWTSEQPVPRSRFLCFDCETTGLAGGSGTRAFMLGAADWHGGRLRARQLYLTAMSGEAAMLDAFAQWIAEDTVLVSYNGRSYDAPLLATRYCLLRRTNPLYGRAHVDLLHPVRRIYRGRWENCRLATIERHVLDIVRDDDLPGAEAPAAWRLFLRQRHSGALMRVLEHNRQDVVTLARLLEHLHRCATPTAGLTSA